MTHKKKSATIKFGDGTTLEIEDLTISQDLRFPNDVDRKIKQRIEDNINRRNDFIDSMIRQYMKIKDISEEEIKNNGLHLSGRGWNQFNYKDDMIIRIQTEPNWHESSVGYQYSLNECLK